MKPWRYTFFLTIAVFALQPLAFGAWLAMIPAVKESLGLNKAELALALLGLPIATVPCLQLAGWAIARIGPRRILAISYFALPLSLWLPAVAGGQGTLFAGLLAAGFVMAFMQVGLNVYAGRFEKQSGAHVMIRCHGAWALGLMAGSLLATWFAELGPSRAILLIAIPTACVGIFASLALPKLAGEDVQRMRMPRRRFRQLPPALFYIAFFALAVSMTEGAMSDWAAIYLAERLPEGATHAGIAVSIYAGFLAVGRLMGDTLKSVLGAVRLARLTLGLAIFGNALLVIPLPLWLAYVGFASIGLGAAVGFPLGVSAVAALDDSYEGANIAIMSSISIGGFLIGPPIIGFLAESFTLRVGLAALLPGLFAGIVFSGWLKPVESESEQVNRGDSVPN